jgi:Domain of unknown function (DUF4394)
MDNSFSIRKIRAVALAFLTLTASLAGCGKGDGGGLTDPDPSGPSGPGPSDPGEGPQGPAPVGDVVYAVDLANNFLVFGTGSASELSAKMRITGVPILKRIIGIAFRPSDGQLMGIGNDSRVYTIDPLTAEATPLNGSQFSPKIVDFFDTHFAMAVEPNGQRVRLIAAESGGNWSISLNDGSAVYEEEAKYAPGTPLDGQTPRLLGIVYPTLPDSAKGPGWCENLAYAIDADEAIMLASCDPATGLWWPTGLSPDTAAARHSGASASAAAGSNLKALADLKDQLLRCGEFMNSPGGSSSDGEPSPPENGPWFPKSPDTPFYTFLVKVGAQTATMGEVMPITPQDMGINVIAEVPAPDPIQSALFAKGGPYGPQADLRYEALGASRRAEPEMTGDPRASCN